MHDQHKERYLVAGEAANASMAEGELFGGITQMVVALGDLQRMWEDLADVAPEEIRGDVEAIRDANQQQLDAAKDVVDNPLKAVASGLLSGLMNAGSFSRVDAYVRANCDVAPAVASPSPAESSEALPEPEQLLTVDPATWKVWGPFLKAQQGADGEVTVMLPGQNEVVVNAQSLLPNEDVQDASYYWMRVGDRPLVVARAKIRTPGSGLQPERFDATVISVDVQGSSPRIEGRVSVPGDGSEWSNGTHPYPIAGTTNSGIVLLADSISHDVQHLIGVDLINEQIAWERSDTMLLNDASNNDTTTPVDSAAVFTNTDADDGEGFYCNNANRVAEWMDLTTGTSIPLTAPPVPYAESECTPEPTWAFADRFVVFAVDSGDYGNMNTYATVDTTTMKTASLLVYPTYVDTVNALALTHFYTPHLGTEGPLVVVDLISGTETFRLDHERVSELGLRLQSFHNGLIYVETDDEQFVIDARAGQEEGHWTVYPIGDVGDYTLLSDGTLALDWSYAGDSEQ